jgi:mono/diheme cytochrome c family protein
MMKKLLTWAGILMMALLGLLGLTLIVIYHQTETRLKKIYVLSEETLVIPTDAESIAYGRRIFRFRGCEACHSEGSYLVLPVYDQSGTAAHGNLLSQNIPRMEGNVYMDDPAIGQVNASNLTTGKGGVASTYTDAAWVRAIRHGVRSDGTGMLFMPSSEFYFLNDRDLSAVIAYIKSSPAVDHPLAKSSLSLTGRIVMALVPAVSFIPAELIPHDAPRPVAPAVGITPEYGEYLTQSCKVCHGLGMSGGVIPAFPSNWPPASNLTWGDGSALANWEEADFIAAMRTGQRPQGIPIRSEFMPWKSFRYMEEDELKAVWVYLESLPKKEYGNR